MKVMLENKQYELVTARAEQKLDFHCRAVRC